MSHNRRMGKLWDEVVLIVRAIRRSTELEIAKRERRAEAVEQMLKRRMDAEIARSITGKKPTIADDDDLDVN